MDGRGFTNDLPVEQVKGGPRRFRGTHRRAGRTISLAVAVKRLRSKLRARAAASHQSRGEWLDRLNAVPGIDAYIVGPSDLEWLERRLLDQPTQMPLTFNSTQATYRERKP